MLAVVLAFPAFAERFYGALHSRLFATFCSALSRGFLARRYSSPGFCDFFLYPICFGFRMFSRAINYFFLVAFLFVALRLVAFFLVALRLVALRLVAFFLVALRLVAFFLVALRLVAFFFVA